ncbi:MAG: RNA polymerase sigma factor [Oscillospiraceae bacterium]|jgi:RNA polymerase sigma-70 factor (ECF subfamily)|nr:RNA polymerase sigma factor [Oscillospiraceae bacterium]
MEHTNIPICANFAELVALARKGDAAAFGLLYGSIYNDLYRYAYFTLKNSHDAEDAVSEAVTDAYRIMAKLKNEASFKAWFFKILSRKCIFIIRSRYKNEDLLSGAADAALAGVCSTCGDDDALELKLAMKVLSAQERMIISLAAFEGYKFEEIATITALKQSTVKTKYYRALQKLEKQMK